MFKRKYIIDIVTTYKCPGSIHEKESVPYGNSIRNLLQWHISRAYTHTHTHARAHAHTHTHTHTERERVYL
jgi:hypothetical protein